MTVKTDMARLLEAAEALVADARKLAAERLEAANAAYEADERTATAERVMTAMDVENDVENAYRFVTRALVRERTRMAEED